MKFEFAKIKNINIRFAAMRNPGKPQLVLVSPQPQSILVYRDWWDTLKAQFDVVAFDLPNHGHSDPSSEIVTVSEQAEFFAHILDHFDLDHPHVVAPDVGTPTLLKFMTMQPNRIKSVTLGDAGTDLPVKGSFVFRMLCSNWLVQKLTHLSGGTLYVKLATRIGYHNKKPSKEILADYYQSAQNSKRLKGQIGFLASYKDENPILVKEYPNIQTPTQILHGEFDTFVSVENSINLDKVLPNSRHLMVSNAAHFSYEDNAPEYMQKTLEWIDMVEASQDTPQQEMMN